MKFASIASTVLLTGCSVFGVRTEQEPGYTVLARIGTVEIRQYALRIAAETSVQAGTMEARSIGFRRLAGYIFGGNHGSVSIAMTAPVAQTSVASSGSQKIPMTAPVAQQGGQTGSTIRFYMPNTYTMESLPRPDDPAVRLLELPAETVAVLRFSGSTVPQAIADETSKLLQALKGSAWHPTGQPFAWFYDPPWTLPWLRRNEVGVDASRG